MARPRLHSTDAARQRAYRLRLRKSRPLPSPRLVTRNRYGVKFVSAGGDDTIRTPPWLAAALIAKLGITGLCLDPCRGDGAFYDALPDPKLWCEIAEGRDFLDFQTSVDWIVTNPPWSGDALRPILEHCFEVAGNVALLLPLNAAVGMKTRNRMAAKAHGRPVRIITFDTPSEFPATGFQLCMCVWSMDSNNTTVWDSL